MLASRCLALLRAAHPVPAAAVTGLAALLGWVVGGGPAQVLALVLAVGVGQLSIGWSNDWLDAHRDRLVARADKPIATGDISERLVKWSAWVAAALALVFSLRLGWFAGLLNILAIASGWAYNLGVKGTWFSWVPYAVTFGLLPAVASLAQSGSWQPWWLALAGAVLGVGAHFINVLPDLADDAATDIRGLPHRVGGRMTRITAPVLLVLATAIVALGPAGTGGRTGWLAVGMATVLAVVAIFPPPLGNAQTRRALPMIAAALVAAIALGLMLYRSAAGH